MPEQPRLSVDFLGVQVRADGIFGVYRRSHRWDAYSRVPILIEGNRP